MTGGEYFTTFKDDEDANSRKALYLLENIGIVKLIRKKDKSFHNYNWEITKKGEEITKEDKILQELWKQKNIVEFYKRLKFLGLL